MTPQEFKDWRARLGLTQARAGVALGKNRRTIAAYEGAANWRGNRIEIPLAVELACKWINARCETCGGTGIVGTPFSGSDPICPDCDGAGF